MKAVGLGVALFAGAALGQQADLQATLAKLDAASARFTSAEARVHREAYNSVVRDVDDKQDGSIYFVRDQGGNTQMGLKTEGKGARTVEYKNGTVRDYNPGINCYDTVTRPGIDTYLTLGFGGSGKDLAKSWEITDKGSSMMAGTKVEQLDLVPKDAGVKNNVSKVTLWVDLDRDVSLKQVFYSPSGDYNTAVFSNIDTKKTPTLSKYAIRGKPCGK